MKIGFIGGGNMASAIIGGMIEKKVYASEQVMASGKDAVSLDNLHNKYGIEVTEDNAVIMEQCDGVFLYVKPQILPYVIAEIAPMVKKEQLFISIAAGKTIAWIENEFGKEIAMLDRGEAKRQFNFITDCIEMCLNILLHAKEYIYNVGGIFDENQNKIVSIANIIGDLLNAKVIVPEYENIQNLHAQSIVNLDIQKYINEFKKNSFVSLKDGIELNIKWIKMLKDNR